VRAQIIADNACAHLFVLGAPTSANWRALDLVERRPVITLREKQFIGHGKNVLGDPRIALTWLANELRQLGVTLRAGQIVTTGTCHPPLPNSIRRFVRRRFRRAWESLGGI
jgi:2-keto-4-pentenoate hydratase